VGPKDSTMIVAWKQQPGWPVNEWAIQVAGLNI